MYLAERIEGVLTHAFENAIVPFEDFVDGATVQRLSADGLGHVAARGPEFSARLV